MTLAELVAAHGEAEVMRLFRVGLLTERVLAKHAGSYLTRRYYGAGESTWALVDVAPYYDGCDEEEIVGGLTLLAALEAADGQA